MSKISFRINQAVSPAIFKGEPKNQDRAFFDTQTCTAALCDGITSSPYAQKAATIVSRSASLIFGGDSDKNLKTICDLLMAHRKLTIKKGIKAAASIPESMKELVEEAAKAKLATSFQTTLVCAAFEYQQNNIYTKVLCCGDSAYFAFSSDGQMLLSNLSHIDGEAANNQIDTDKAIYFSQGTELLTKIVGPLCKFSNIAAKMNILNAENWVVCHALSLCTKDEIKAMSADNSVLRLKQNELILAPKYLFSMPKDLEYKEFRRLLHSRFIRQLSSLSKQVSDIRFSSQGAATAVLPDHYYTGQWKYFEERFAPDTHFLLCSDGFYHAFSNPAEIWDWLKTNEKHLAVSRQKKSVLTELHQRLNQSCGDDDISFIWVKPKDQKKEIA